MFLMSLLWMALPQQPAIPSQQQLKLYSGPIKNCQKATWVLRSGGGDTHPIIDGRKKTTSMDLSDRLPKLPEVRKICFVVVDILVRAKCMQPAEQT